MIRLDGVSRQFDGHGRVTALHRIDLTIARGEMVSIVGPSGSGKSTLLNLMGTLDRPTAGQIHIDGVALDGLNDAALTRLRRDKIGFIFQFFNLLPALTCLENVALPLHLRGWRRSDARARATELLTVVGLEDRLTHRPDELSGGQRQRVAIARALSIYPPVLLADEPTGNLDSRTSVDILNLLHDLHARVGATVVVVTHDDGVAASCGRTVTLRDGRIVDDSRRQQAPRPAAAAS
jgi:ABC-type lipoprotein export system ATPase subunit